MKELPQFSPGLALIAPVLAVTAVQTVDAAGYLKIGDIKGESTDAAHLEWTEIESFEWGVVCDPPAGGRQHKPITITKEIDKSSPILMLTCATGNSAGNIPEMILAFNDPGRNGGEDYLKIVFTDVIVSSYDSGMTEGTATSSSTSREHISFTYQKVTWTYIGREGGEPVEVSHDFSDPTGG